VHLSLDGHPTTSFFGVFDGHGGKQASQFFSENLPVRLSKLKDPFNEDGILFRLIL
jgi:serine/threonine protein phosphatase PrpC